MWDMTENLCGIRFCHRRQALPYLSKSHAAAGAAEGDRSRPVEHKGKADFYEIDEEGREKAHITSKG